MLSFKLAVPKLNKVCSHILSTTMLAGVGLTFGLIPNLSSNSLSTSLSISAAAQQFTPEETANYAKAGYEVELLRRDVYKEIKTLINEPPPTIVCDREETFRDLDSNILEIVNRYCSQSQQIVQQNNLSVNRYNELKGYYDRRDNFYQQVQNTLIKLQN